MHQPEIRQFNILCNFFAIKKLWMFLGNKSLFNKSRSCRSFSFVFISFLATSEPSINVAESVPCPTFISTSKTRSRVQRQEVDRKTKVSNYPDQNPAIPVPCSQATEVDVGDIFRIKTSSISCQTIISFSFSKSKISQSGIENSFFVH